MINMKNTTPNFALVLSGLIALATISVISPIAAQVSMTFRFPNGGFEEGLETRTRIAKWKDSSSVSLEAEGSNHFLRLRSTEGQEQISSQQFIDNFPYSRTKGIKSLKLSWRQRVTKGNSSKLVKGTVDAYDYSSIVVSSSMTSETTTGWQMRSVEIPIAKFHCLLMKISVVGGTCDVDDFTIVPLIVPEISQAEEIKMRSVFDKNVKNLPPNFRGNDMKLLFQKLEANTVSDKSEYETTVAYRNRLNSSIAKAMGMKGTWNDQSLFTAVVNDAKFKVGYDADQQKLIIPVSHFGGLANFQVFSDSSLRLLLTMHSSNINLFPSRGQYLENFSMQASPERAKKIRQHLKVLVAFRLIWTEPKLSNGLMVEVKEIWFFNSQTGQVYDKWVAKKSKP